MSFLNSAGLFDAITDSGGTHQWNTTQGSGTTLTDSIGTLDGDINGATWTTGKGTKNVHLDYDGSNDTTNFGSASQSELRHFIEDGTGTILQWIRPDSTSTRFTSIGSELSSSTVGFGVEYNVSKAGEVRWVGLNGSGSDLWDARSGDVLVSGEWQVVAMTVNGSGDALIYHAEDSSGYTLTQEASDSYDTSRRVSSDLDDNVSLGFVTGQSDFHFDGGIDLTFIDNSEQSQSVLQAFVDDTKQFY